VAAASDLDSLLYKSDDSMLYVDFMLPVSAVSGTGIETALDEHGLTVECLVTIEVRKPRRLGHDLVVKSPIVRTLRYSKFYDEYILSERGSEPSINSSYYKSLDMFRRFTAVEVIDLYLLEAGEDYTVVLDVRIRAVPAITRDQDPGKSLAGMGLVAPGSVLPDVIKEWQKKGAFVHIEYESSRFTASDLP
jgi:hypothetical protein